MILKQQSAVRYLSLLLLTTTLAACSDSGTADDPVQGNQTSPVAQQNTAGTTTDDANNATNNVGSDGVESNNTGTAAESNEIVVPSTSTDGSDGTTTNGAVMPVSVDVVTTTTENPTSENPDTTTPVTDEPGTDMPNQEELTTEGPDTEAPNAEQPDNNPDTGNPVDVVEPNVTGGDQTNNDDDSPTETESASIAGPFIKDTARGAGPPSVPEGLTLLMSGEDFVEFSWKPSTDDQSVEAYEIYRDGTLVYTIEHDNTYEFNYRYWISTSYQDCNYTRIAGCDANPITPGSSYQYQVAAIDNEGMKSGLSAPVTFQMAQRQSGGPDLSGYAQVLNEEFDGEGLDRALWKTSLPWGPNTIINREQQYFVNLFGSDPIAADPFVFTGSSLQITGTITPPELLAAANNQPYLSGVISTQDKFQLTYGYVEMKAKLTGGQGLLSTFYLFNQDFMKNKPEIDIAEYIGGRPDKIYQTYHYYDSIRNRDPNGERHSTPTMETQMGFDLSADFHTYSVLWEPDLVVWYIDGNEVRRLTGVRISDEPMNIVAQLVVGSEWIGEPDASTLPKVLEIDYIKAWQKQ